MARRLRIRGMCFGGFCDSGGTLFLEEGLDAVDFFCELGQFGRGDGVISCVAGIDIGFLKQGEKLFIPFASPRKA
ncbi:MAG TPA: hypothetical protein VGN63_15900 [Flavisolibacter sp.]|nr:hypothetical protein [Flavisolibacter sp.]